MKNSSIKEILKKLARAIARILVLPFYFGYICSSKLFNEQAALPFYAQLFSFLPGLWGMYLRREFYRLCLTSCSADCHIGFATTFSKTDVEIDAQVYIGNRCSIGSVSIGKNTIIASGVHIISGTQQHQLTGDGSFIKGQFKKIKIGESCWIGEAAVIAANIGSFSKVAAGAVVLKEAPQNVTLIGNPAKSVASTPRTHE